VPAGALLRCQRCLPDLVAVAILIAGVAVAGGCAPVPAAGSVPGSSGSATMPVTAVGDVVVFAAASLREAFDDVASTYASAHPGTRLALSFDASSALRTRIEQSAAADLFASADSRNVEMLVAAGLAAGQPSTFASTSLVIVVSASREPDLVDAFDLAGNGVRIVAAGRDVPISRYAAMLVEQLAAAPGAPPGFAAACERNVVSREDNARAVLAKVELGEADAGIVYRADAAESSGVRTLPLPSGIAVRATYVGVVPADVPHPGQGDALLAWLVGRDGQAVLRRHGFEAPP
jgi:molybdate transport system substrate-binding protein